MQVSYTGELNNTCDVLSCVHWAYINDYYRAIVTSLQMSMNECIPVLRHGALKPYWCEELQELKKVQLMRITYGCYVIDHEVEL